jgi:nitrate reductase delta subunit
MDHVLSHFAQILDYPNAELQETVKSCIGRISPIQPESAHLLAKFHEYLQKNDLGRLQELYTGTFELQGCCNLYVGHYLFGEQFRRSLFMVKLKEHYRKENFSFEKELPDHLCVLLRFLAAAQRTEENDDLISECIIPSLSAMVKSFQSANQPYRAVLQSLLLMLQENEKERMHPASVKDHSTDGES